MQPYTPSPTGGGGTPGGLPAALGGAASPTSGVSATSGPPAADIDNEWASAFQATGSGAVFYASGCTMFTKKQGSTDPKPDKKKGKVLAVDGGYITVSTFTNGRIKPLAHKALASLTNVMVQTESTRKGFKKVRETTMLFRGDDGQPDLHVLLTDDVKNQPGSSGPDALVGAVRLAQSAAADNAVPLDVEIIPEKEKRRLEQRVNYNRPPSTAGGQRDTSPTALPASGGIGDSPYPQGGDHDYMGGGGGGATLGGTIDTTGMGAGGAAGGSPPHHLAINPRGGPGASPMGALGQDVSPLTGAATDVNLPNPAPGETPLGVPEVLWFICPQKMQATGKYIYNPDVVNNGAPTWDQHTDVRQRLYKANKGHWVVGYASKMAENGAWVVSVDEATDKLPHQVQGGWLLHDNGRWEMQPSVRATNDEMLGTALTLQAEVLVVFFELKEMKDIADHLDQRRVEQQDDVHTNDLWESIQSQITVLAGDWQQNAGLLAARRAGQSFSELEVEEIRQLLKRLTKGKGELAAALERLERILSGSGDASLMKDFVKPAAEVGYPKLTATQAARGDNTQDDILQWAYTLQASRLKGGGKDPDAGDAEEPTPADTVLRMTCRADVLTSNRTYLNPCAVAITDASLYLCEIVGGNVLHHEPAATVSKITMYTDRRYLGVTLSNMELFITSDHEHLLVKHLKEVCSEAHCERALLDAAVVDAQLRVLLELDSKVVEQLREEIRSLEQQLERRSQTLNQERKRFQEELDRHQSTEDARVEKATSGHLEDARDADRRMRESRIEETQTESRRIAEREEAAARIDLVSHIFQASTAEAGKWCTWARKSVMGERAQLVLACTSTVEKAGRAGLQQDEAAGRLKIMQRCAHPLTYLAIINHVFSDETAGRAKIVSAWTENISYYTAKHLRFVQDYSMELYAAHARLRDEDVVVRTELEAVREKCEGLEIQHRDEVNRVGALLGSTRVMQKALATCRFVDVTRMRMDNMHLREEAGRQRLEVEALAVRQKLALDLCAALCESIGDDSTGYVAALVQNAKAVALESEVLCRPGATGDLHSPQQSLKALAMGCQRVARGLPKLTTHTASVKNFIAGLLRTVGEGFAAAQDIGASIAALGTSRLLDAAYPVYEGWLFKKDMTTWRKRYFLFQGGALSYQMPNSSRFTVVATVDGMVAAEDHTPTTSEASFPNAIASPPKSGAIQDHPGGGKLWVVKMVSGERVVFSSPTPDDRQQWIAAIRKAIELHAQMAGRGTQGLSSKRVTKPTPTRRSVSRSTERYDVGMSPAPQLATPTPTKVQRQPQGSPMSMPKSPIEQGLEGSEGAPLPPPPSYESPIIDATPAPATPVPPVPAPRVRYANPPAATAAVAAPVPPGGGGSAAAHLPLTPQRAPEAASATRTVVSTTPPHTHPATPVATPMVSGMGTSGVAAAATPPVPLRQMSVHIDPAMI